MVALAPYICRQEFLDKYTCNQVHSVELHRFLRSDMELTSHKLGRNCAVISCGCELWQYGLWSFQTGGTKLEKFCLRINILKGNYSILRIGLVGASEVFKNQSLKSQLFSSSQ